jgi:hypothetical protein
MSQSVDTNREQPLANLAAGIKQHLLCYSSYEFRPVRIDGLICRPIIYTYKHVVLFEVLHIFCTTRSTNTFVPYCIFHATYSSIENALEIIMGISTYYKVHNGDLHNPDVYHVLKQEEKVMISEKDPQCCICLDPTIDTTPCGHHVCLRCRQMAIIKQRHDCPICRNKDVLSIYTNEYGLVNNDQYVVLRDLYEHQRENENEVFVSYVIDRIGDPSMVLPDLGNIEQIENRIVNDPMGFHFIIERIEEDIPMADLYD